MKLADAYGRLQWGTPTTYEQTQTRNLRDVAKIPPNIGTSAHMLIELYLDMAADHHTKPAQWLVVCADTGDAKYLRKWLGRIDDELQLPVQVDRVLFFPLVPGNAEILRGYTWYSWAIFCDHSVKENDGHERNLAPYRFVRSVEPVDGFWIARDRDHDVVCHLTNEGMNELVDAATCPVTIIHDDMINTEVTYPAIEDRRLNGHVRLRKTYAR